MTTVWHTLRLALLACAAVAYLVLGYLASASSHPPVLAVVVGTAPLALAALVACWRSRMRVAATLACVGAIAALAWHLDALVSRVAWLYFVQHAGTMAALAILFGGTLGTHEGALCSRIAKGVIGEPLDSAYLRYTWQVTLAWTVYFVACAVISVGLFFLSTQAAWSMFAAVVTPVSVGALFVGEYLIRLRVLPGRPHFNIAETIRSYRRFQAQQGRAEP